MKRPGADHERTQYPTLSQRQIHRMADVPVLLQLRRCHAIAQPAPAALDFCPCHKEKYPVSKSHLLYAFKKIGTNQVVNKVGIASQHALCIIEADVAVRLKTEGQCSLRNWTVRFRGHCDQSVVQVLQWESIEKRGAAFALLDHIGEAASSCAALSMGLDGNEKIHDAVLRGRQRQAGLIEPPCSMAQPSFPLQWCLRPFRTARHCI